MNGYLVATMAACVAAADLAFYRRVPDIGWLVMVALGVCLIGRTALQLSDNLNKDETFTWTPKKRDDDDLFDPNRKDTV